MNLDNVDLTGFNLDFANLGETLAELLSMPERVLKEVLDELEKIIEEPNKDAVESTKKFLILSGQDVNNFSEEVEKLKEGLKEGQAARDFENKQQERLLEILIRYMGRLEEILLEEGLSIPVVIPVTLDEDGTLPTYQRRGDAGCDIYALEDTIIEPKERKICKTGVYAAIPEGFEIQIRLRSSIALKTPLLIPNAPGTIDSGYRDEIGVILYNTSDEPFLLEKGQRFAQMVLNKVETIEWKEVDGVKSIGRDRKGGLGSTGE